MQGCKDCRAAFRQRPQRTGATHKLASQLTTKGRGPITTPAHNKHKPTLGMTAQPPCKRTHHISSSLFHFGPPSPIPPPILQLSRSGPSWERQRLATGKTVGTRDSGALARALVNALLGSGWRVSGGRMPCCRGDTSACVNARRGVAHARLVCTPHRSGDTGFLPLRLGARRATMLPRC